MGPDAYNQELIELLAKVKEADQEYPQHLLTARREQYLQQLGQASLGAAVSTIARQSLLAAKESAGATLTSKLIEAMLVAAILAEAGAIAYLFRDKLTNVFQTHVTSESGSESIASPEGAGSQASPTATPSPGMTLTVTLPPTLDIVATPTLGPGLLDATDPASTTTAVDSTPDPNGNNGHHYGQTPKPERTKENGGNDDPPPQEPRPTKKPKPTKTK